ncbi:Glycosyltransferase, GT2 family [Novosphingobium sp. CF614]|uniref:glycosyltransferase family 2 protein n=1 Tax=Novosphingobium sp. CF614 TaxID=1884364 RepID=UPI0008E6E27A|nr:glycosyltransferase family 2 protein [Novosphingobium sp. CF614]SFG19816.1 Glycosyltransferase, GT2 family [Novosphingobium sp. CF614]
MLRVHLHALRHAPRAYLTAAWWRLFGKRARARAQFAPLLAVSPLAYRIWLRGEAPARGYDYGRAGPPIFALVDVRAGRGALDETLRSLEQEGVVALAVGTPDIPDLAEAARRIDWRDGAWLLPVAVGDVLAPGAAAAYRRATDFVAGTRTHVVYADDDLLDAGGQRHAPHFKPGWNAELYRHFDYLTGACIVRAGATDLAVASGADWAVRLVAFAVEGKGTPQRLPHVLHHRRSRPAPRVPARVVPTPAMIGALPLVSVLVPTRNRLNLLRTCIKGLARTDYPDMEVIIVDNGSDDPATLAWLDALDPACHRVLRAPGPFNFSTLNNRAAHEACGQLLCLLNNDIEVLSPDWLAIMAAHALRPEVGAVGARLLYPDGRIQHAGVVLGVGGGAAHAHRLLHPDEEGYFRRHALPQFVSAVTAACLVVQRARFEAVGGLDEANFAVAFNDVDLCMRLNARGWQSLYEPRATLVHHESVSRGLDRDPVGAARLAGELAALKARWNTDEVVDPYHHPQLNRFSERFVVRL